MMDILMINVPMENIYAAVVVLLQFAMLSDSSANLSRASPT